jgi:hypothetical protein
MRIVGQNHGVKQKEWLFAVSLHEVDITDYRVMDIVSNVSVK